MSSKERLRSAVLPPAISRRTQADRLQRMDSSGTVNVKKLNRRASKALLDGVLDAHGAHDDQSILLEKVRHRLEAVGLSPPCVEVRYHDLKVSVDTTVAARHVPTMLGPLSKLFATKKDGQSRTTRLDLLAPCSGVLKPGRLALVLGPPGSGRTTFLRALTGRAQAQSDLKVAGEVTYNGKHLDEFEPAHAAAYVGQQDLHYGELTVAETLDFAAQCFGAKPLRELLEVLHDKEEALGITPDPSVDAFMKASAWGGSNTVDVELTIKLLGLQNCADTVVGNAMLRGVSGGEKKRVTSGEILVGPARVLLGDEISTGLDSRTTTAVVSYLRGWTKALNGTVALALLQPTPETYELFDDVILLSSGVVVYSGPREGVLPFFSKLGFECPARCGVAEFLQEVTTPTDQQKYWSYPGGREYAYVPAAAMADAFAETDAAEATAVALGHPYQAPSGDQRLAAIPLPKETYGASYWKMWKANGARQTKLQSRNAMFLYVRLFQIVLMSAVTGTVYLKNRGKDSVDDGNLIMGSVFFSMIYMLMAGIAEQHVLAERLPVFYRQREMKMYPGSAFALPAFLWRLPYCLLDALLWSAIMYFAVGLDASADRFFMFVFLMFLTAVWSTSLNQAVCSVVPTESAQAVAMFIIMILLVNGGYVVVKSVIPGAWKAAYYANPWFYLTQALAINEFTGSSWSAPYNTTDAASPTLGQAVLIFRDFDTSYSWVWYGCIIVIASTVLNVGIFVLAANYKSAPRRKGFITEDALAELECNREAKPVPASMKKDIEMGMKRTASMAKLKANRGSNASLASLANASTNNLAALLSASNGDLAAMAEGNGSGNSPATAAAVSLDTPPALAPVKPGKVAGGDFAGPPSPSSSSLPFEPMSLTFQDVSYSVPVPKSTPAADIRIAKEGPHAEQLQLLHNISGSFRPGVLSALMGASGAGKTTLMDVLAGRKTGGRVTGDIRISGFPKDQQTFARVSAYVEQEDTHFAECTVEEALEFSAALRLPSSVSTAARHAFVKEVTSLVELGRLSEAIIGNLGEGASLSIEQRKRLTIAIEMVSNPSILFMDEPTTGLDARGASVVMSTVRATAATGRTVVCTIHQPSIAIFEAFDELLVLKPGGHCIYNGPMGFEAASLISYFSVIPGVEPMQPQANPANWMLEQTAPRRETELGVEFSEIFASSEVSKAAVATAAAAAVPPPGAKPLEFAKMSPIPVWTQFWLVLARLFTVYWRMPGYNISRFAVTTLVMVVFGSLFYGQGQAYLTDPSPATVINIVGVLFVSALFMGATNGMTVMAVVGEQRRVFYRERAAGMYTELPYAIAQGLVEVPFLLVQTMVYVLPVYYLIGFDPASAKVAYFFLFFFLTLFYFTEFGAACANLTPDLGLATLLMSFIFNFMTLFAGLMIPAAAIGWYWRWFVYVNPISWTLYALLMSQLGNVDTTIDNFGNGVISIADFMSERFSFDYDMVPYIIAILAGFVLLLRGVSVYALTKINYQNR